MGMDANVTRRWCSVWNLGTIAKRSYGDCGMDIGYVR